ncbi:MAG: chorismate mutase [Dehalococcoidia bacterium]
MLKVRGVRGATTAEANTRAAILEATRDLLQRVIEANGIDSDDVAYAYFSTSPDLQAEFPAVAAREMGWVTVPLICGHDMAVPDSLARCVRILILWNTEKAQSEIQHLYLREAAGLRRDISGGEDAREGG